MVLLSVYAALAIVAAVAVFLAAEWLREPGVPAPDCSGRCALAAGLLWPVIILGIAQWGLIVAVQSRLSGSARPTPVEDPSRLREPVYR